MDVELHPAVREELIELPAGERNAMARALEKLQALGTGLSYPHTSQVQGTRLRELRPRAGRSPWRALYIRMGNRIVVVAIAPEAQHDPREFRRSVEQAQQRIRRMQH